jgi:acyl-CoA reductase-like NAD-dependent aldehyde dehydrogenase
MQMLDPDLRALQEVRDLVARARRACEAIHDYDQARTDALCAAMAKAGAAASYDLARLAVEETGIGRVHYKVLKNLFGSEGTWASIQGEKTVGILSRDERSGIVEIGTASGVIAGIIPTTNPTSTALFKSIISVKGRNAIVISPHPRARRCIYEAAEVLRRAIERAGGPPDLVVCLSNPTIESTGALMRHKDVALILATGGTGLVKAAYSSGKPAYGVGPGNVPLYIDRSADIAHAAESVTVSQSFDNGTLCCSEQALVLDKPIAEALLGELKKRGAHVCDEKETAQLARYCNQRGHMNPDVVGLDPWKIAEAAGFHVPRDTTILLAHQGGVGPDWPLSIEILAPVLSVHVVEGWEQGCRSSIELLNYGGLGHTLGVHARDQRVLDAFFLEKPASRIIVNGPTSQGAVGYSTNLMPSFSLGCGPQAGNITSENITARHLVNVKRAAYMRRDWKQIEARDHARVGALTGEGAPRGSGQAGDPALSMRTPPTSFSAFSAPAASNWQGNSVLPTRTGGEKASGSATATAMIPSMQPKVAQAVKSSVPMSFGGASSPGSGTREPAPRAASPLFAPTASGATASGATASGATASGATASGATASGATASLPPAGSPLSAGMARSGPYVGAAFTPSEIQTLMTHAGSGCPMGPCKGCPHHEVTTGSCKA